MEEQLISVNTILYCDLKQITEDRTFARSLVEGGEITEMEARRHDARHHF